MKHARPDYDRFQDPEGKIPEDEPVMLFRAQDKFFIPILEHYVLLLQAGNAQPEIIQAVKNHISFAKRYHFQRGSNPKSPDIPVDPSS